MIFVDVNFYENEYLLGREIVVPLTEFLFWSRKASEYVNNAAFGRIDTKNISEAVKLCVCEIAECYYTDSENQRSDNIKSETVGGHSISYTDQRLNPNELQKNLKQILNRHLADTGLLYRGAY